MKIMKISTKPKFLSYGYFPADIPNLKMLCRPFIAIQTVLNIVKFFGLFQKKKDVREGHGGEHPTKPKKALRNIVISYLKNTTKSPHGQHCKEKAEWTDITFEVIYFC